MIEASCFTNIDERKHEKWPTQFVAVPSVGDWVESESGRVLGVVKITHAMVSRDLGAGIKPRPVIRVELHNP